MVEVVDEPAYGDAQGAYVSPERFEIREKLGSGGMGVVFRVYDRERRIEVALKTLRKMEGAALYRFKKEFRWLADLAHPNLVTLYELGSTGSQWFFTMELVDGVSFLEYVRPHHHMLRRSSSVTPSAGSDTGSPLTSPTVTLDTPPVTPGSDPSGDESRPGEGGRKRRLIIAAPLHLDRLRSAFAQLVGAVEALHQAGKLHCDIKPSNVLVRRDERVVLCDFGLIAEADSAQRTVELGLLGTPLYMAPEQAEVGGATAASDWYAVGVMLYEALTGRLPFWGQPQEVLRLKRTEAPTPPQSYGDGLPEDLARIAVTLLSREPSQRPTGQQLLLELGAASERGSGVPTVGIAPPRARGRLVGRDEPLAQLRKALLDTRTRMHSVAVFMHGPSGIGKTAVAREFLDQLTRDGEAIVLEGRCYDRESVPFKALDALIDALSTNLLRRPTAEVESIIPRDITAAARLFPVLERVPAVAEAAELRFHLPDPHELRRRAFGALRAMLGLMAEARPVALFIDDLQWGDLDSAGFLSDVIYHFNSPAVLLLATYRREEAESSPLLRALRKSPSVDAAGSCDVRELALEPLSEVEARELIGEIAGPEVTRPDLADAIVRESGGSPLFLCELAHAGLEDQAGEIHLDAVLRGRIERLPEEPRELLTAVAVGGQPILTSAAARAARVQDEAASLALLQSARLVRTRQVGTERRVESYHERIRETVTAMLSESELRRWHRRLARSLETLPEIDPLALVGHWQAAGDEEKAGHYAARAGELAERALAFDRAAQYYRLALELQRPVGAACCALLCRIGDAQANAGRLIDAAETYVEAASLAEAGEALELRRRAMEQFVRAGKFDDGLAQARGVLAEVGMRIPRSTRRAMISVALSRAWVKLRGLGFRERPTEEVAPLIIRRMELCYSLSGGLAVFQPLLGTAFQMRHLRMALRAGEPYHVALALAYEVGFRSIAGVAVYEECESLTSQARALAERIGNDYALANTLVTSGLAAYLTGHWQTARERLEGAERSLREIATGVTFERNVAVLFRFATLLYLGEIEQLVRLVPVYLREANERGDEYLALGLRSWRSNLAWLALDDPAEAEVQLARAAEVLPLSDLDFHLPHYYRLLTSVQIALYRGDFAAAWAEVVPGYRTLQRSLIKRIQFTRVEGAYLYARVALARAHGEVRDRMLELADKMARTMTRERCAWGDALAVLIRGLVAAARGDRPAATSLLAEAARRADDERMVLFAQVARWRQGEVGDGEAAVELTQSAEAWMHSQRVVSPARFVALFAPLPSGSSEESSSP